MQNVLYSFQLPQQYATFGACVDIPDTHEMTKVAVQNYPRIVRSKGVPVTKLHKPSFSHLSQVINHSCQNIQVAVKI